MKAWCEGEPLVLVDGEGAVLRDSEGREYIDGNSSIWTNIHGHKNPKIDAAIRAQLDRVAHVSFLGTTNEPAIRLAEKLVGLFPARTLDKVFYSDDGSTAIEVALKMSLQYWQLAGSRDGGSLWLSTMPTTATRRGLRALEACRLSRAGSQRCTFRCSM